MISSEILRPGLRCLALPRVIGELRYEAPICLGYEVTFLGPCSVGAFTYMNNVNVFTNCSIGRYCSLGHDILVGPGQHEVSCLSTHPFINDLGDIAGLRCFEEYRRIAGDRPLGAEAQRRQLEFECPTRIGNDVWIGSRAIIMNGLTIGDGAVIGAGAVVTKNVEPYSIVVGVPARVTRRRFPDNIIETLLELKWWQRDLSVIRNRVDYSNVAQVIERLRAEELPRFDPTCYTLRTDSWDTVAINS